MPERIWCCPKCNHNRIKKHSHIIERYHFANIKQYESFKEWGNKSYFKHEYLTDIEEYFGNYNTLQWDNLIFED